MSDLEGERKVKRNMKPEENKLMYGQVTLLEVDPRSNELVNLYLPKDIWKYLIDRFGGNKMTVTLRGPHDLHRNTVEAQPSKFEPVLDEIFRRTI